MIYFRKPHSGPSVFPHSLSVIFKETVGTSWDILYAILGHKYHENHSNRAIQNLAKKKPTFAAKVTDSACKWVSPRYTIDCFTDISEACAITQELDLDQNVRKEHRHTEGHKYD